MSRGGPGRGGRARRRSWRARLLELLLWALVAVATAVILVLITEEIAPPNF